MKRSFILPCSFLLLVLLLSASCERQEHKEDIPATVVTSIFPVYDIVMHIAGEGANVRYVVPVGANPHHYEPLPATVAQLQHAKLFIGVHREFDGWITDLLPGDSRVEFLIPQGAKDYHANPHIWLTPRGGKRIAHAAARLLSLIDPQHQDDYEQNLSSYLSELEALDSTVTALFAGVTDRKFIQWHPAWDLLARDYQLTISATIEQGHGDEPSVKEFKQLIDEAKSNGIRVVVIGLHAESRATEALVREIDGVLLELDTIGDPDIDARSSYIKLMRHNALLLSKALGSPVCGEAEGNR